jgi:hypothetical protein
MKTSARIGGILDLSIIRANGDIEHIGKIHNVAGNIVNADERIPFNSSLSSNTGVPFFGTQTTTGKVAMSGSFSQSGTTVTRESGSFDLTTVSNGDLIVFSGGQRAYKTASIGASSCTVSKSQGVSTTTADRYKTGTVGFGNSYSSGASQTLLNSSYAVTSSYSNGVFQNNLASPRLFAAATSGYTMKCMSVGIYADSSSTAYGSFYDFPSDIIVNIGDRLFINSWRFTITYDDYLPRVFAVSPLSGVSGSGRYQRLFKVHETEATLCNRIYLISDANKIAIPNMIAPDNSVASYVLMSGITRMEDITAVSTTAKASFANNCTQSNSIVGTVTTGGSVKQILWGTQTRAYGVIEYDTPITISAGQVITLQPSHQMTAELP